MTCADLLADLPTAAEVREHQQACEAAELAGKAERVVAVILEARDHQRPAAYFPEWLPPSVEAALVAKGYAVERSADAARIRWPEPPAPVVEPESPTEPAPAAQDGAS